MREAKPSLTYRLAWLFPPVGLIVFALVIEGHRVLDFSDPQNVVGGLAAAAYFLGYAWVLGRDALRRSRL